jgi:hypothetical protein
VERVADDHERRGAAGVHFAVAGVVAMPPQHQLLEKKKSQYAGEERAERGGGRQPFERLRQQREQRDAEQGADGVADGPRHNPDSHGVAEKQERGRREQAAETAEHAQADGRRVKSHAG